MTDSVCSDLGLEPLPGTAKSGTLLIALEHQYGWSRDILDGGVFGDELTARIKSWLAERGGSLQLIRKPGRLGQIPCDGVTMYVAHCPPRIDGGDDGSDVDGSGDCSDVDGSGDGSGGEIARPHLEVRSVADVEEMLSLNIQLGRRTEGARAVDKPLLLVCTHGKRDRCCAVNGRPIAQALNNVHPGVVWETSHAKGHRFAPALMLLPWNYSYGRLSAAETNEMLDDASSGLLHPHGCRGRGVWDARGQVAELAARGETGQWGINAVAAVTVHGVVDAALVGGGTENSGDGAHRPEMLERLRGVLVHAPTADAAAVVEFADGRAFGVALGTMVSEGVVSSCGDAPGPKKGWRALASAEI